MSSPRRPDPAPRGPLLCAAVAVALLVGGCAQERAEPASQVDGGMSVQEQSRALAQEFGITDPPAVEVVRTVEAEERGPLVDQCLTDAGYPPEAASEEGIPLDQVAAHELAQYRCLSAYPIDPRYTLPYGEEQIAAQYRWTVETVVPCLREHGFEVSDPPSRDVFVATWRTDPYFPFAQIPAGSLSNAETDQLNEDCPQDAPSELLYP